MPAGMRPRAVIRSTAAASAAAVAGVALMTAPAAQAATAPAMAHHPVVIQEIFYNSPGADHGSNTSLNAEWVELRNRTSHAVSLAGWTLRDRSHHVYQFGAYSLRAHRTVRIHTGSGTDSQANLFQDRGAYVWNNTGDGATLKDGTGTVRSRCSYSDPHQESDAVTC
jgi:hypothetical protein